MVSVHSILSDFSHLFFPHICAGCGSDAIGHHSPLCIRCVSDLPQTNFHLYHSNPIEKYFWGRMAVANAAACYHFTDGSLMQHLLHQVKYRGNQDLGLYLGRLMAKQLQLSDWFRSIDLLLPLPLFAARLKKRGYNQSEVLCRGMSEVVSIPVMADAVARLSATETQTHKNRIDRWTNMQGRFELLNANALRGRNVLLVDDVVTTGATLEACGEIINSAGATLHIATLAYTV